MAGWISSKLKVAENLLHQIDQQAAESLGKGERPQSPLLLDEGEEDEAQRKKAEPVPVKLQLPKKPPERGRSQDSGNRPARVFNSADVSRTSSPSTPPLASPGLATSSVASMDGDWTKLLSSPNSVSTGGSTSSVSFPSPRSTRKHGFPNRRSSGKPGRHAEAALAGENMQRPHKAPDGTTTDSYVGSDARRTIVQPEAAGAAPDPLNDRLSLESRGDMGAAVSKTSIDKKLIEKAHTGIPAVAAWGKARDVDSSVSKEDEGIMVQPVTDLKGQAGAGRSETGSVEDVQESAVTLHGSPDMLSRITPKSSGSSESDSDSASSSDSEYESERKMERRKRKERVLAEKAAALAAEAIKERENLVARLEGEKQSLEKVVEERQKQQAQEASQLQSSMMEAMEAVEREKQKHNSTRMEALALLAELETRNAELARSLATTQWDLQVEVNRVMELREMVESKELAQEELRGRMSDIRPNASSDHKEAKRNEYEREALEAEYYFICDKIGQMKEKVGSLERNIQSTEGLLHPTEVEIELKKRLEQFTDHLIQKQAQVESLSSEKATLLFRIETISRLLEEEGKNSPEGSARVDIEAGGRVNRPAALYSTLRPLIRAKIDSGERQLGSFVRQVDDVFAAGAVFLRKNPTAKVAAWTYLVCLHLWVAYILTSDSSPAAMAGSSSERINKTSVS